jgi:chromosome segregation ATPase
LEWLLARGVLRPRLGWGFHDNGSIDTIATGLGIYLSPMQIDVTYLIPTNTLTDNAGQIRASLVYRFGRPQFSEIYYDKALEQASQLDQSVLTLSVKEAALKESVDELDQKKRLAKEELENLKGRIESLKKEDVLGQKDAKIRELAARVRQLEGEVSYHRGEAQKLRIKKAEIRTHIVAPGDTLQSLAKEYYGDPNQWKKIYNANEDKIDRGLPRVGAKLVIP